MVELPAVGIITSSLNNLLNIAKAMIGARDASVINANVIEMQRSILEAQEGVFAANQERAALIQEIGELKNRLSQFENWETEKQRYELKDVGTGAFAYALKPSMSNGEPAHYVCANCYQDRQKSILHRSLSTLSSGLTCSRCKNEIAAPDPRS